MPQSRKNPSSMIRSQIGPPSRSASGPGRRLVTQSVGRQAA